MVRRNFCHVEDVFQDVDCVDEDEAKALFTSVEDIETQLQSKLIASHEQERKILAETLREAKILVIS
ncbi:MAG: hypothetical protein E7013_06030 [Alphaproteobacteria bacterium]|nr:hypothetical protein [Alphaproteobacteria bacterium]